MGSKKKTFPWNEGGIVKCSMGRERKRPANVWKGTGWASPESDLEIYGVKK